MAFRLTERNGIGDAVSLCQYVQAPSQITKHLLLFSCVPHGLINQSTCQVFYSWPSFPLVYNAASSFLTMSCRAIERGQWVLLDNANLCNPTVLDRLNPLLEPQGELYLNECGTGTNGPRVLKPHPNFRLFLALDPR